MCAAIADHSILDASAGTMSKEETMAEKISIPGHGDGWVRKYIGIEHDGTHLLFVRSQQKPMPEVQVGDIGNCFGVRFVVLEQPRGSGLFNALRIEDERLIHVHISNVFTLSRNGQEIWRKG